MSHSNNENPFFGALDGAPAQNSSNFQQNQSNDPFNFQESSPNNNTFNTAPISNSNSSFNESVENLQEICPTVDREIVEVILQNNDSNFEAALNELLALSDPNYAPVPKNTVPLNNQVLTDEEYAKALQAEEEPPTIDQTKADEDYARAILAAEQGHLEDLERLQSLSLAQSGMMSSPRHTPSDVESKNTGISTLVEKSKKKLAGLFGRNPKDSDRLSISDQPLSPRQQESYSRFEDDRDSLYDVHQEVILERRDSDPRTTQTFSQPPQPNIKGTSPNANMDLLGDDPPENIQPVTSAPHFNTNSTFSGSLFSQSPPRQFNTAQNQMPSQIQHNPQGNTAPLAATSNNPFFQDIAPTKENQNPPKNPFE